MKKLAILLMAISPLIAYTQMTTVNYANQYTDCGCYQLTSGTTGNTKGAIWSPQTIDLTAGFDMTFNLYFGTNDTWGADGMTFVLQQNSTGIGDIGHSLGYEPPPVNSNPISAKSLAVEFDVWDSGTTVPTDLADDHIAVNSDGSVDHNVVAPITFPSSQNIEDGAYHEVRFVYDPGTSTLAVFWEGSMVPLLTYTNSTFIADHFNGNPIVYWGFTASTGGVYNEMRVCAAGSATAAADITTLCPGTTVNFTGTSTSDTGIINGWSWDFGDGGPIDNSQNPSYTYNTPGNYSAVLTVTDGFGCDRKDTVDITVLPDLILTMDSTAVSCYGDSNGVATATPTNGTGPYSYTWNDPANQTTQSATGLSTGIYAVVVTDDLGCTGEDSVLIDQPLEILLDMGGTFSCFGDSTGEANVSVANGIPPLSYMWDDYNSQTTDTATNLPAGMYTVTVTDDSGCVKVDSVSISENPEIVITGTTSDDNGTNNGAIDITVSGGSGNYSYSWDNGQTTEDITNLATGSYTVTVTDSAGCSQLATFFVKSSAALNSFSDVGLVVYPNPTSGEFTVKGNGEFELQVTDTRGRIVYQTIVNTQKNIDFTSMEKGVYILIVSKESKKYQSKLIIH